MTEEGDKRACEDLAKLLLSKKSPPIGHLDLLLDHARGQIQKRDELIDRVNSACAALCEEEEDEVDN
jgi:hypothetical protein